MKRFWLAGITLVLIAGLIAGCTASPTATPTARPTAAPTTVQQAATSTPTVKPTSTTAPTPTPNKEPIKIGVIYSMNTPYGPNMVAAQQAYAKMINDAGGILGRPIQLINEDSQMNAEKATAAVRRLASQGVVGLLGDTVSAVTVAMADVAGEVGIPHLGSALAMNFTEPVRKWSFSIIPHNRAFVQSFVARERQLGNTKLGYYYTNTAWGTDGLKMLNEELAKNPGLQLVSSQGTTLSQTEATVEATKLKASGAQSIIILNYATETAALYRAMDALGWKPHIIGAPGTIAGVASLVDPKLMQGTEGPDWYDPTNPSTQKMAQVVKAFDAKWDQQQAMSYVAWEDMMVLLEGIKRAGSTDRAAIRDAIENIKNLPTQASGAVGATYSFSPQNHYAAPPMVIKSYNAGKWDMVK